MSGPPDDPSADKPTSSRSSLSGSSNGPAQPHATLADDRASVSIEKTISCVSCRKRKLKCDRAKPRCGTCVRLRNECEYPERRRNLGSKRRNMKELEARLAQVETQLVAETKAAATSQSNTAPSIEADWNDFTMDINMDTITMGNGSLPDQSFNVPLSGFDFQPSAPVEPEGNFYAKELIALGLQEPLPPPEMIEELHEVFFLKCNPTLPMVHKARYLAALNLPAHMQPAVCLRYAIWATAASVSDRYLQYEDAFYERARRYVEAAEMKGHGETFISIHHAQTWVLIATYEAKKTYFTRAWMSTGRATRLTQMLGLHRLDVESYDAKRILPPPKDWVEMEERRRTFWSAFYGDRWASSGTGWPMIMDENEIQTNLPSSEESFEYGIMQNAPSLSAALTPEGASKISPFGGVILSACLFGHNFQHLHKSGPDEHPEDLTNGEFWKRHRRMDNVLSNTFMFLPDHLRIPGGLRDMNVVFLHMNIHASCICLHQAAVLVAEQNNLDQSFIRQSRDRTFMAAEEIANIMRLVSHFDASAMNSWMGFCLYVAGGILIHDEQSDQRHPQTMANLEFILAAMKAIGIRHSITNHFIAQLELDIDCSGIRTHSKPTEGSGIPNTPINGIDPSRRGNPMTVNELGRLTAPSADKSPADDMCPYMLSMAKGSDFVTKGGHRLLAGILPRVAHHVRATNRPAQTNSPQVTYAQTAYRPKQATRGPLLASFSDWNLPSGSTLDQTSNANRNTRQNVPVGSDGLITSDVPVPADSNVAGSPFNIDSFLAENTPSSESSSSNTMQFPYRQADPSNRRQSTDYAMLQPDPNSFIETSNWTFSTVQHGGMYAYATDPPVGDQTFMDTEDWGPTPGPPQG